MKFSIITVVKNGFPEIELTIKSVLKQNYKDFEYIIFDGNSTDGTSEYIKKNFKKEIKYFRKSDNGMYDGLNRATRYAKGDYLLNLHAGDFFYSSSTLDSLNRIIKKNKAIDFFFSDLVYYNNKTNKITRIWSLPQKNKYKISSFKIAHTSLCLKRKIAQKIIYDDKLKISADTKYLLNLCKFYKGKYIKMFIIFMQTGGLSTSIKFSILKIKEDLIILYKEFNFLFIFYYFYKICIKLSGYVFKRKSLLKKFIIEKKKLISFKNC